MATPARRGGGRVNIALGLDPPHSQKGLNWLDPQKPKRKGRGGMAAVTSVPACPLCPPFRWNELREVHHGLVGQCLLCWRQWQYWSLSTVPSSQHPPPPVCGVENRTLQVAFSDGGVYSDALSPHNRTSPQQWHIRNSLIPLSKYALEQRRGLGGWPDSPPLLTWLSTHSTKRLCCCKSQPQNCPAHQHPCA